MKHKTNYKKLLKIFTSFFKIGSFTFGGGFAMIPLIGKKVSKKREWVKKDKIIDMFAISQSMPGAIAINSATLIGHKILGVKGAIAATSGVVLPSFFIILFIAAFFPKFQDNYIVQAAFKGIRPAVATLIFTSAFRIGKSTIKDNLCMIIAIISFILIVFFDVHVIFTIIAGAITGLIIYRFSKHDINIKSSDKR